MQLFEEIKQQIAQSLGVDPARVRDDLEYQSISEWDSVSHFNLILDLENRFKIKVEGEDVNVLTSVKAIAEFILLKQVTQYETVNSEKVLRGLRGVYFDTSQISKIDTYGSQIYYRGLSLPLLIEHCDFESVAYLLLRGGLPSVRESRDWKAELFAGAELSDIQIRQLNSLRDLHPTDALRSFLSMAVLPEKVQFESLNAKHLREATRTLSLVPTVIATHHRLRRGLSYLPPDPSLGLGANFLYMISGERPSLETSRLFNQDLTIHAEHSSNASTFAARVAMGAQSSFSAAVTTALATFSGRIHGGAVDEVLQMFNELQRVENVAPFVNSRMQQRLGVPGFGHRVYRVEDPRAALLLKIVCQLAESKGTQINWPVIEELKSQMLNLRAKGMEINVDFYSGLSYRLFGIPDDMAVAVFFMARLAGISAHILEQSQNNILIRPLLKYIGPIHENVSAE